MYKYTSCTIQKCLPVPGLEYMMLLAHKGLLVSTISCEMCSQRPCTTDLWMAIKKSCHCLPLFI